MCAPAGATYCYHTGREATKKKTPGVGGGSGGPYQMSAGRSSSATHEGVALLVLLAGPARARIVASDLRAVDGAHLAPRRRPAGGDVAGGAVALLPAWGGSGRGGGGDTDGRRLLAHHAHLEELLQDHFLQALDHLLKHVERFFLVLGERIALTVAAEPDALLEVIHAQEMIFPELIDPAEFAVLPAEAQHDPPLEAVEHLRPHLGLALSIGLHRELGDLLHELLR